MGKQTSIRVLLAAIVFFLLTITGVMLGYRLGEKRSTAHLYVGTTGGSSEVILAGRSLGAAPIKDYTLGSGRYDLDLVTEYYTYSTSLQLNPKTATVVDWQVASTLAKSAGVFYELSPQQEVDEPGLLRVVSIPDRAAFSVDGTEEVFFSPTQVANLRAGDHILQISLPGYQTHDVPFTLTPGYLLTVTVKLAEDETEGLP